MYLSYAEGGIVVLVVRCYIFIVHRIWYYCTYRTLEVVLLSLSYAGGGVVLIVQKLGYCCTNRTTVQYLEGYIVLNKC